MKCTKENTFKARTDAYYAMLKVPIKDTGQMPFRIYWCPEHKGYHYTSKVVYKRREQENARNPKSKRRK